MGLFFRGRSRLIIFIVANARLIAMCDVCGHVKTGEQCAFCVKKRGVKRVPPCRNDACAYCNRETLASCERALRRWGAANAKQPRDVWKNSSERVELVCEGCNRQYTQIASRVPIHDCALCVNKSERRLYDALIRINPDVIYQPRFDWAGNVRYDFMMGGSVLVELDGPQHFRPVTTWKSGFDVCDRDKKKEDLALANGMSVIRVLQEDVWSDAHGWRAYLETSYFECVSSSTAPRVVIPRGRKEYDTGVYARMRAGGDGFF